MVRWTSIVECWIPRQLWLQPQRHQDPLNRLSIFVVIMCCVGRFLVVSVKYIFVHTQSTEQFLSFSFPDICLSAQAHFNVLSTQKPLWYV